VPHAAVFASDIVRRLQRARDASSESEMLRMRPPELQTAIGPERLPRPVNTAGTPVTGVARKGRCPATSML
jgi:hypothetical protein